ncbi:hypothetical protein MCOR25_007249 [Pyricularia grisea]|nr:hypothetical protein MCOR25_007249 [Pyricularia grisea]
MNTDMSPCPSQYGAASQEFTSSPISLPASSDEVNVPDLEAFEEDLFATSDSLDEEEELESEHVANLQRTLNPSVPAIVFTPPSPKLTSPRSPVSSDKEKMFVDQNSLDPDWVCREKLDFMIEKDRQEEKRRRQRKRRGVNVSEKELRRQINELETTLVEVSEEKRQLKQKNYRQERQLRQLRSTPLAKQALQTLADVAEMEKKTRARSQAFVDLTVPQDQHIDLIIPMEQSYPRQSSQSYQSKTSNAKAVRESVGEERAGKRNELFTTAHENDLMSRKPVQGIGVSSHTPAKLLQLEAKLEQNSSQRALLRAELAAVKSRMKAFLSAEDLASKMLPHLLENFEAVKSENMKLGAENIVLKGKLSRLQRGNAGDSMLAFTGRQPDNTNETL